MRILSILLILVNINICLAEDPLFIEIGKPAPYTGFLISREKAERIRLMDIDLQFQIKKGEILNQELTLTQDQLKRNNEYVNTLSNKVAEMKDNSMFTKIGFFILGALITGGIAFGVSRAMR